MNEIKKELSPFLFDHSKKYYKLIKSHVSIVKVLKFWSDSFYKLLSKNLIILSRSSSDLRIKFDLDDFEDAVKTYSSLLIQFSKDQWIQQPEFVSTYLWDDSVRKDLKKIIISQESIKFVTSNIRPFLRNNMKTVNFSKEVNSIFNSIF